MDRSKTALKAFKAGEVTLPHFFETICREITEHVGSTRASIWTFAEPLRDAIICETLFDSRDGSVQSGAVLKEEDFPAYFAAITESLRIVAPDAITHPATSAFDDVYFAPLDIRSLLDFVIMLGDRPVGVLCCEHCAEQKDWTQADLDYLQAMSSIVMFGLRYNEKATQTAA